MILDFILSFSPYQILTPLLSVLMITILVSRKMRRELSNLSFIFGMCLWLGIAAVALFPAHAIAIFSILGIKEGVRGTIFLGLIVLSLVLYKLVIHTDRLDQEITSLARVIALRDLDKYRTQSSKGGYEAERE